MANNPKHLLESEDLDLTTKLKIMAGVSEINRGTAGRGLAIEVRPFSLLDEAKHGIRAQIEKNDAPQLGLLPNGVGYVAPAWKLEMEKYRLGQEMAWERIERTGSNLTTLFGGLAWNAARQWGVDADAASDLGAQLDIYTQIFAPHPLNTQEVVNAPTNYVRGAPTHEVPIRAKPPSKKALQPPPIIDEKKQAKALKPLEEELKAAARGTKGSITAAPEKVKNIERGLTTERPARPAKPSNTQKKQIILDYSRERPIDPLDNELSMMERPIALERDRVGKIRLTAPKEWNSGRAGITKRLYNLLERRAALFRAKVWPDRRVLEQARLLGVIKDGKLVETHRISKSGKGRIADIATLSGDQASTEALLEDLKTSSTELKSIKGGLKSEPVEAEFRSRSEIGKQHEVEDDVMKYARKHGGKLVIEGKNVRTGKTERIEIDPANVSRQVTDYNALPDS